MMIVAESANAQPIDSNGREMFGPWTLNATENVSFVILSRIYDYGHSVFFLLFSSWFLFFLSLSFLERVHEPVTPFVCHTFVNRFRVSLEIAFQFQVFPWRYFIVSVFVQCQPKQINLDEREPEWERERERAIENKSNPPKSGPKYE